MFTFQEFFPGVFHIQDAMGVSFTLLRGREKSLLADTGYGLENVHDFVACLAGQQVEVVLTHGHHDHVLGSRWFPAVALAEADFQEYCLRTALPQRQAVAAQAKAKGLAVPEDFLTAAVPQPAALSFNGKTGPFFAETWQLGGLTVHLLLVPGHTPGHCMVWVPAYRLLLTGDNWNPCTWVWFPSSLPVREWLAHMRTLMNLLPVEWVLCPHQPDLFPAQTVRDYLAYLTDERLRQADPVNMGSDIQTRQLCWENGRFTLVFDAAKNGAER